MKPIAINLLPIKNQQENQWRNITCPRLIKGIIGTAVPLIIAARLFFPDKGQWNFGINTPIQNAAKTSTYKKLPRLLYKPDSANKVDFSVAKSSDGTRLIFTVSRSVIAIDKSKKIVPATEKSSNAPSTNGNSTPVVIGQIIFSDKRKIKERGIYPIPSSGEVSVDISTLPKGANIDFVPLYKNKRGTGYSSLAKRHRVKL